MDAYKDRVLQLLCSDKIRHLYANTYYSLHDRIDDDGYIEESFVPGRYPGNYTRTSGAYSLMMGDLGNLDLAERPVRCVLDAMRRFHLFYAPHVLGKRIRKSNGESEQFYETVNQIDGTGHILLAYANLVLDHGRDQLLRDYWEWISSVMDINLTQPNFCGDDFSCWTSTTIHLFFNPMLEHSRENRYWACFDILTQCFMGAALEKFIRIAENLGQTQKAARWQKRMDWLRQGVRENLTTEIGGKLCYAEMRIPNGNRGTLFEGLSWLNLSALAADWDPVSPEITENTVQAVRSALWLKDPQGDNLHYLNQETHCPRQNMLGKSLGWDLEAALRERDYCHIYEILNFLFLRHDADVYCENMEYREGKWICIDNGNGEQCVWWCRSIGRLRKALGLSPMPDREDITHRPQNDQADFPD